MGNKKKRLNQQIPSKLEPDMLIGCQWCDENSTVKEWDDNTKNECKSRAARRSYLLLYNTKTFNKEEGTLYKCPKCGSWSESGQLILITDNKYLRKLGGKPLVRIE